jgi:hypothetical protein
VRDALSQQAVLFFKRSNQFLFSPEKLKRALEEHFTFGSLSVAASGKGIELMLEERTSNLIWMADQAYVVDLQGIVVRRFVRETETELASRLPMFYDVNQVAVFIGSPVLTPFEIEQIFRFHEILAVQGIAFTQTNINRIVGGWMSIVTQQGYEIYFDANGDIEGQGEHLKTVLAEEIEDPDILEYIDLRFGDRVYFK